MTSSLITIASPVSGTLLRIEVSSGQAVRAGDLLATIESMKMEIPVESEHAGTVAAINVDEAALVEEGQALFTLRPA